MTKFTQNDNRDMVSMEEYYIACIEARDRRIEELEAKLKAQELENDFLCRAIAAKYDSEYHYDC